MKMQRTSGVTSGASSRPAHSRCVPSCSHGRASSGYQPARPPAQRRVKTSFAPDKTPEVVTPTGGDAIVQSPPVASFNAKDWAAAFSSQPGEFDYWIEEVEGTIPEYLQGTLFRNGPGNFERGGQRYHHMLDGDGYVCRFSFAGGNKVHFLSRYVQTRELIHEEKAGSIEYRSTFGTQRVGGFIANAFDLYLKNPANTNVVEWGKRLLALWEAGCPYELDPRTLGTKANKPELLDNYLIDGIAPSSTGRCWLDKILRLGSAFTAHPHIVADAPGGDQRLVTWSWRSLLRPMGDADMAINVVEYDSNWERLAGAHFTMQHGFFNPHDFAITPSSYIFFQHALSFDMGPYLFGFKGPAQCIEFEQKPMKVHMVPRSGGAPQVLEAEQSLLIHHANAFEDGDEVEVFEAEQSFLIHHANAFEDGDEVEVFEAEQSFLIHHANAFEDGEEVEVWSSGWGPEALKRLASGAGMLGSWKVVLEGDFTGIPFTALWKHRINAKTGKVTREAVYQGQNLDHPRVNPNFYSRPTRYVYFNAAKPMEISGDSGPPQLFTRLDVKTGEAQSWCPGDRCFCEELIFVPGPRGDVEEDDGVLLGMVFDGESMRTSLAVMDAKDFSKGPLARIHLSHHVPHGLHGFYSDTFYGPQAPTNIGAPAGAAAC